MATLNTSTLPLLPLNSGVILPGMIVTLALETPEARAAVDAARGADNLAVVVPRLSDSDTGSETSGATRYARVGTVARIENSGDLPGGVRAIVVRGLHRAIIGAGVAGTTNTLWVSLERAEETNGDTERAGQLAREYRVVVESILEQRGARRFAELLHGVTDPGSVADTAGYWPELSLERKVELLETLDIEQRLERAVRWVRDLLGEMELKERIRTDVADGMEKTQREFLLRQQLAAIRKELGDVEGGDGADDYRQKLEAWLRPRRCGPRSRRRSTGWSGPTSRAPRPAGSERGSTPSSSCRGAPSPTTGWTSQTPGPCSTQTTPGWTTSRTASSSTWPCASCATSAGSTPSSRPTTEWRTECQPPRHRGHDPGPGRPPRRRQDALGESVARAMGRRFVRVALGGVRDEAEIRGHRRTYVGALPGRIVRAIKEAGTMNPVVLLDEVDKLGSDWRGDPSSGLLEVLDPAQNHTFRDHYLEVDLDLSNVLFLATANMAEQIPGPLLDRMEVVRLDGYTEDEKVAIARDHLLARQLRANGLTADEVVLTTTPCGRSSPTTPGRPVSVRSSGSWASCCARRPPSWRPATHRRPSSSPAPTSRPGWAGPASSPKWPSARPCRVWRPVWPSPAPEATCCSSRPPAWPATPGSPSPVNSATS